jgi:TolA-binding protein
LAETSKTRETKKQLAKLRRRIEELESEVQENRRLNRRLAELTDVVQELLVPISQRDEDKLRERLEKYSESL